MIWPFKKKSGRWLEVYLDGGGVWRWHTKSPNGQVVATSNESFDSKYNAIRAAQDEARDSKRKVIVREP